MIVSKDQARWITQGRKTTHWQPAHRAERTKIGRTVPVEIYRQRTDTETYGFTSAIVTGGTRTVSPLVKEEVVRVTIIDKQPRRLADMTVIDARAAGYRTTDDAITDWINFDRDKHPRSVSVLRWIDQAAQALNTTVVVLSFEIDRKDHPRFLAPTGRPDRWDKTTAGDRGYTTRNGKAIPGEPEAVDVTVLDPAWTQSAQARHRDARRVRELGRELRSIAAQIRQEGHEAARDGVDIADNLDAIRRELEAIRDKRCALEEAA